MALSEQHYVLFLHYSGCPVGDDAVVKQWVHPLAFIFKPAHSVVHGAEITQPLLELGRLKR